MAKPIDVTENIEECIDILDQYVNKTGTIDVETAQNAIEFLKITKDNALSSGMEPRGCPHLDRKEKVK